jgi:hypothetical protein
MLHLRMDLISGSTAPVSSDKPENWAEPARLPAVRGANGRFAPGGGSANPGGRPKIVGDVRDLARAHTAEAIATLVEIMRDQNAPAAARGAAANVILDRGWGRPSASVAISDDRARAELEHQVRIAQEFAKKSKETSLALEEVRHSMILVEVGSSD